VTTTGHPQGARSISEPHAIVGLYRIAPGKQLEFLKWMAGYDADAHEAGLPLTMLYAHTDGDSWDYMSIGPMLSKEQNDKLDAVSRSHGRKVGFASALEFRTLVASHTDTYTIGPTTATDLVAMASK